MSRKSIPHRVVLRTFWKEDTTCVLGSVFIQQQQRKANEYSKEREDFSLSVKLKKAMR